MSNNRVLVTGGAGFLGSHLVDALIADEREVTVLDNLSTGKIENVSHHLGSERFHFVEGDVRDAKAVREAVKDVEAVFHLAAVTSVPFSVERPFETFQVNVDGTRNLLEACLNGGIERFVYVSSCAVYGEPRYLPIDEGHPLNPISPYAESKLKAEQTCREFHESHGLKYTIMRPFNVYGPRQRNDEYSGVIAKFIDQLRAGKLPVICGDGLQTRDFVFVVDAVDAFLSALRSEAAVGRVFNVGTGAPISVNELARLLSGFYGFDGVDLLHVGERKGDIMHSYASIKDMRLHLRFEPRVSLKEGLLTIIG
jgi:UDP-glucose 4-epimerase